MIYTGWQGEELELKNAEGRVVKFRFGVFLIILLLFFGLFFVSVAVAQADRLVLEWEQHWETYGKGGCCNFGTHNFFVGDVDGDGVLEMVTSLRMLEVKLRPRLEFGRGMVKTSSWKLAKTGRGLFFRSTPQIWTVMNQPR